MAATNYTPIQLYHSTTASASPAAGNLVNGELAINILDGKLYYKDNGGTVQIIASKGTGTIGGSTTQVQYNLSGALAGSSNFTFDGTTATINTLNLTNALGAAYGGTAQSTYAQGDLLYASAANTLAKLPIGISTYILTSNGSIPGWSIPSSVVIGTATNLAGGAAGSVPYQSGASTTAFLSIGTVNQVITSTGSAPQWSSGLSITTLTASDAVTFSATTQNIALGTSQTSGTFTVGGAAQTGTQTFDQSTKTHTLNIGTGATENAATKTVNLATAGVSGSTTTMSVGSAVSGAITNLTVNATTTLAPIARSTGAVSYFTVTTPADTGLTASTEVIGSSFSAATRTWATGALTLQRERVFAAPTYAFAGASTLTTAVNVDIGLPVAGTNATITNAYALRADNTLFTGNVVLNNASAALDLTNLEVTNIKAKDGTASMTLADSTGIITLSATAGTANGVAYLNGSRALTTGSALTFDGTNLGVNSASPIDGGRFSVAFAGNTQNGIGLKDTADASGASFWGAYNSTGGFIGSLRRSSTDNALAINGNSYLAFQQNSTELMRLTSTGLGIGTNNPVSKLTVKTATNENLSVTGGGGDLRLVALNDAVSATVQLSIQGSPLYFRGTGGAINATLDSSGNLGLGVTPSAWSSSFYKAIEGGDANSQGAIAFNLSGTSNGVDLWSNGYFDGTNSIYKYSAAAGLYQVAGNVHRWYNAPSGTANSASVTSGKSYTVVALGSSTLAQWQAFFNDSSNNPLTVTPTLGQVLTGNATGTLLGGGLVTQNISFTQAMTLDASGNLGIGTNSPSYKLDVAGIIRSNTGIKSITASGGQPEFVLDQSGVASWTIYNPPSNTALRFYNGVDRMTLDSSGNLGIGTSSPGAKLEVVGEIRNASSANASPNTQARLTAYRDGSNWGYIAYGSDASMRIVYSSDAGSYPLYFGTSTATDNTGTFSTKMTLDGSGNLGVGITSPTARLHLKGPSGSNPNTGGILFQYSTNTSNLAAIGLDNTSGDLAVMAATGGAIRFHTNSDLATTNERARITSGGDLLVGTTTTAGIDSGSSSNPGFACGSGTINLQRNNAANMFLSKASGYTSSTYVDFYVAGLSKGSITTDGTNVAYNTSSDYRLKDNQQPLTGSGAFIDALKPKTWDWKSGGKGVGFIAHEVQEVSPGSVVGTKDAVDKEGKPIMQAMEYGSAEFIANIIAELQSLRARVAQLEQGA